MSVVGRNNSSTRALARIGEILGGGRSSSFCFPCLPPSSPPTSPFHPSLLDKDRKEYHKRTSDLCDRSCCPRRSAACLRRVLTRPLSIPRRPSSRPLVLNRRQRRGPGPHTRTSSTSPPSPLPSSSSNTQLDFSDILDLLQLSQHCFHSSASPASRPQLPRGCSFSPDRTAAAALYPRQLLADTSTRPTRPSDLATTDRTLPYDAYLGYPYLPEPLGSA